MTLQWMPETTWIDNAESMMQLVRKIRDTGECALDTETTGLDRRHDYVLVWSLCPDEGSRYCLSQEMLPIYTKELAPDPDIEWYFTNQTFDFNMLANTGALVPQGRCYDTLAMDWLRDENRSGRHGLKETAWDYLELDMKSFNETFPSRKRGDTVKDRILRALEENPEKSRGYASEDAWATFRVYHKIRKDLEGMYNFGGSCLWDYFTEYEVPFTRTLYNCGRRGIMVDVGYLDELSPNLDAAITDIQKQINKIAGKEINLRSPIQLRELFFNKLKVPPVEYTSGGQSGNRQPSTNEASLKQWAEDGVEAAQLMMQHRSLSKTKGTYVDGLRKWVDHDLRIHTTMTQHVTATGRLSSVEPNLQNIPRPSEDVFGLRSAFMPKQDHVLLVIDYEQLEMRLLAHMAEDKNMIDVINRGWDIHAGTASLMFGHKYEDIQAALKRKKLAAKDSRIVMSKLEKQMCFDRQAGKNIGFGINYGEGPRALAAKLGVSIEEAKRLKAKYFEPYPSIRQFVDDVHAMMCHEGMVETIMGRPRRFPEMLELGNIPYWQLKGSEKAAKARAERQGVNSVIQGSAADVAKLAMLKCEHDERLANLGVQQLLQVHDELIFEVPEETIGEAMPIVINNMEHPFDFDLSVPLDVDSGTGYSWASAKA